MMTGPPYTNVDRRMSLGMLAMGDEEGDSLAGRAGNLPRAFHRGHTMDTNACHVKQQSRAELAVLPARAEWRPTTSLGRLAMSATKSC